MDHQDNDGRYCQCVLYVQIDYDNRIINEIEHNKIISYCCLLFFKGREPT